MNWIKRIISKFTHKRRLKQLKIIESQFESIFLQIEKILPLHGRGHSHVDESLGKHYTFNGSWLHTNFYFDIFKGSQKLGRIYVGYFIDRYEKKVSWHCINRLNDSHLFQSDTFSRLDLARAINAIVPELVEDSNSGNR